MDIWERVASGLGLFSCGRWETVLPVGSATLPEGDSMIVDRFGIRAVALSLRSKWTDDFMRRMSAESLYDELRESLGEEGEPMHTNVSDLLQPCTSGAYSEWQPSPLSCAVASKASEAQRSTGTSTAPTARPP